MLIQEIIQAIRPLQVIGLSDDLQNLDIRHLLTDSRQLGTEPEATLFFALKTEKNDGANYIPELLERGVRVFVVSELGVGSRESGIGNREAGSGKRESGRGTPSIFLLVENPLTALQQLAAYKRSLYNCPVIAITGSNGKTVVKECLWQLLNDDYFITRSPKSYNSQIGVPLAV